MNFVKKWVRWSRYYVTVRRQASSTGFSFPVDTRPIPRPEWLSESVAAGSSAGKEGEAAGKEGEAAG